MSYFEDFDSVVSFSAGLAAPHVDSSFSNGSSAGSAPTRDTAASLIAALPDLRFMLADSVRV